MPFFFLSPFYYQSNFAIFLFCLLSPQHKSLMVSSKGIFDSLYTLYLNRRLFISAFLFVFKFLSTPLSISSKSLLLVCSALNSISEPVYFCYYNGRDDIQDFVCGLGDWNPNFQLSGTRSLSDNTITLYNYANNRADQRSSNLFLRNNVNSAHLNLQNNTIPIPGKCGIKTRFIFTTTLNFVNFNSGCYRYIQALMDSFKVFNPKLCHFDTRTTSICFFSRCGKML